MFPYLTILLLSFSLVGAQTVPYGQIFDCTNSNFQDSHAACKAQDYAHCCAGGCCDLTSICVGQGTPQETCCAIDDPTLCGTGPALPLQSVLYSGGSGLSKDYCPHGSNCNKHDDTCSLPGSSPSPSSSSADPGHTSSAIPRTVTSRQQAANSAKETPSTLVTTGISSNISVGVMTIPSTSPPASIATISVLTVSTTPTAARTVSTIISTITSNYGLVLGASSFFVVVIWL
ncbi:hypothetical protein EG329_013955 [Mollisiaceae sp. DMI_Dod_QoI]|nr:hypothetical protein EG329_013955 [Helotiales sp. DMI_Dod_QoI]